MILSSHQPVYKVRLSKDPVGFTNILITTLAPGQVCDPRARFLLKNLLYMHTPYMSFNSALALHPVTDLYSLSGPCDLGSDALPAQIE